EGLKVTVDTTNVAENGGVATVTVTRGQFSVNAAETLAVKVGDSSELSGPDSVTFVAGQRSVSFELHGVDDEILDGTQSVTVSVESEGRTRGSLNVDVTDHEELSLSVVNVEVPENAGDFQLTLRRGDVDDLSSPVSVELSVPEELRDRIELPSEVVIAAGDESTVITVGVNDNDVVDGNHAISITASAAGFVSATAKKPVDVVPNAAPTIASIDDQALEEGESTSVTIEIADADTPLSELSITATSGDASVLSVALAIPEGSGAAELHLTRLAVSGPTLVTVTAGDGTNETSTTFEVATLIVDRVLPTISSIDNQELTVGETTLLPLSVADEDTPLSEVSVTATSDDDSVLPEGSISVEGTGAERTLSLSPAKSGGPVSVTVTVNDGVHTATKTFNVTVTAIEQVTPGLARHYTFNGGDTSDHSGRQQDAEVHGATLTEDRFGNADSAYLFDGVDDFISASNESLPAENDSRTIAVWARFDSAPVSSVLAAYGSNSNGQQSGLRVVQGKWQGSFWGFASDLNTGKSAPQGEWVHVALTYDAASKTATFYENGIKVKEKTNLTPNTVLSPNGLTLGKLPQSQGSTSFYFHGALDDVRVYDTALTAVDIAAIRDAQPTESNTDAPQIDASKTRIEFGEVRFGVPAQDRATGDAYIMYTEQHVHERWTEDAPNDIGTRAEHLMIVRFNEQASQWEYDTNHKWVSFESRDTDVLLAAIDFDNDEVSVLQGVDSTTHGMKTGVTETDLVVTPNTYNGKSNAGEFGLQGSFAIVKKHSSQQT
ncbi:unnamed protein product, partial [Discosporangium mesarthrocarpum]